MQRVKVALDVRSPPFTEVHGGGKTVTEITNLHNTVLNNGD